MTKLRFDNLTMQGFNTFSSFKLVEKKRKPKNNTDKRLTKLIKGICLKEGDDYKISLNVKTLKPDIIDKGLPDLLVLDFTEESYNLKGVVSVFERKPDNNGRYTRYIRNESYCKVSPGSPEKLVPFCKNWVCSGYIIRRNGKLLFDFHDCIAPRGYAVIEPYEDE